ncbi:MAG: hypothetical protein ABL907_19665 [Hyphomicrobium sp.]
MHHTVETYNSFVEIALRIGDKASPFHDTYYFTWKFIPLPALALAGALQPWPSEIVTAAKRASNGPGHTAATTLAMLTAVPRDVPPRITPPPA